MLLFCIFCQVIFRLSTILLLIAHSATPSACANCQYTFRAEELVHQLLRAASIMMFLLMPLAARLLKGAYFRQHRYYLSHLIFTVHLHCFAFIILLLGSVSVQVPRLNELTGLLLLVAIYFVVALVRFYGQSLRRTLAKAAPLGVSYLLVLGFSMVAMVTVGALMF